MKSEEYIKKLYNQLKDCYMFQNCLKCEHYICKEIKIGCKALPLLEKILEMESE